MKNKLTIISGLLAGLFISSTLWASTPVYRKGCEFPLKGVELCWEATAGSTSDYGPFPEMHLLPITRMVGGEEQILAETTRKVFRQLLPGNLTERLVPEWTPVFHLEEAMMSGQEWGWPAYIWISPRTMRNSSEMSSGVLDWDVYLFSDNRLARTLRIRVESKPNQSSNGNVLMATAGAFLVADSTFSPTATAAALTSIGAVATANPPEAGRSLEILTELATRQILFLAQFPINDLNPPGAPIKPRKISISEKLDEFTNQVLAPK